RLWCVVAVGRAGTLLAAMGAARSGARLPPVAAHALRGHVGRLRCGVRMAPSAPAGGARRSCASRSRVSAGMVLFVLCDLRQLEPGSSVWRICDRICAGRQHSTRADWYSVRSEVRALLLQSYLPARPDWLLVAVQRSALAPVGGVLVSDRRGVCRQHD